jgi:hypothetical protein
MNSNPLNTNSKSEKQKRGINTTNILPSFVDGQRIATEQSISSKLA